MEVTLTETPAVLEESEEISWENLLLEFQTSLSNVLLAVARIEEAARMIASTQQSQTETLTNLLTTTLAMNTSLTAQVSSQATEVLEVALSTQALSETIPEPEAVVVESAESADPISHEIVPEPVPVKKTRRTL